VTMPATKRSAGKASPAEDLIHFARGYLREDHLSWEEIAGEGSARRFYRIAGHGKSVVVMAHERPPTDRRGVTETDSFLYIAQHLRRKGIAVPEIYHYDMARGWFIMEDLGDCHLQTEVMGIKENRRQLIETYHRVIDILIRIQVEGRKGFDLARTHNVPYDQGFMLAWESGYFHFAFLVDYLGLDIPDEGLREELADLALRASEAPQDYFLYRDFQSRNIMVRDNVLGFVDFQGGRLGPLQYDLASLVLDPYVELDEGMQDELLAYYLLHIQERIPLDPQEFREFYPFVAIHRAMQVLGAFAFLIKARGLGFFRSYIPRALRNLRTLLGDGCFDPYKKLKRVVFEEIKGI